MKIIMNEGTTSHGKKVFEVSLVTLPSQYFSLKIETREKAIALVYDVHAAIVKHTGLNPEVNFFTEGEKKS